MLNAKFAKRYHCSSLQSFGELPGGLSLGARNGDVNPALRLEGSVLYHEEMTFVDTPRAM